MSTYHLTLPSFIESPPRIPVAVRHGGAVLAALRRHSGYRFTDAGPHHGETQPWMDRKLSRRT